MYSAIISYALPSFDKVKENKREIERDGERDRVRERERDNWEIDRERREMYKKAVQDLRISIF